MFFKHGSVGDRLVPGLSLGWVLVCEDTPAAKASEGTGGRRGLSLDSA